VGDALLAVFQRISYYLVQAMPSVVTYIGTIGDQRAYTQIRIASAERLQKVKGLLKQPGMVGMGAEEPSIT